MSRIFVIAVFCGGIFLASLMSLYYGAGANNGVARVIIPDGASLSLVGRVLKRAGIVHKAPLFIGAGRVFGYGTRIRAGEYDIPAFATMADVFIILRKGEVVHHPLTIAEGLTSAQIMQVLSQNELLVVPDESESDIPAEGSLLPETYYITRGTLRGQLVERMQKAQAQTLATLWAGRQKDLPIKSPYEALILASIIEKETGQVRERAHIAAVFHNRLRRNMRLQSDPTIIYGLTAGRGLEIGLGRPILRREIEKHTPYNTYRIDGLPPTPIANVGRAALLATLHPSSSRALYFVADGAGGHRFAQTLAEHNANVRAYRKTQQ